MKNFNFVPVEIKTYYKIPAMSKRDVIVSLTTCMCIFFSLCFEPLIFLYLFQMKCFVPYNSFDQLT